MIAAHAATSPEPGEAEIAGLLRRVRPRALWLLRYHRIPPQDADDLLQQTMLVFLYKHAGVRDPEAWVLGTLRHKCLRYWRNRRLQQLDPVGEEAMEQAIPAGSTGQEIAELRHDLELALARLPERCRRVLRQRYGLGYRATEIAESLGYPAATVRKISSRCLQALARELRAEERR